MDLPILGIFIKIRYNFTIKYKFIVKVIDIKIKELYY